MHAMLALAGTYLLDYLPSPALLASVNRHYQSAVEGISDALQKPETFEVAKGDSVISAILLLLVDDVSHLEWFWNCRQSE
jgi:hypothetical protein